MLYSTLSGSERLLPLRWPRCATCSTRWWSTKLVQSRRLGARAEPKRAQRRDFGAGAGGGPALAMRVEDVQGQNRRLWVRLHEKGGRHDMPCLHNLEAYLTAYLDGCDLRDDRKGLVFRTLARGTRRLGTTPLPHVNALP